MSIPDDGFPDEVDVPLAQIIPDEQATKSGVRTRPVELNERDVIHYADRDSDYFVCVRRLLAIDGLETKPRDGLGEQLMSLIVLEYDMSSMKTVKALKVELVFDDMDEESSGTSEPMAKPEIVARQPFATDTRWNPTAEDIKTIQSYGIDVGVSYAVDLKLHAERSKEAATKRDNHTRGFTEPIYAEEGPVDRWNGVRWILQENASSGAGTPSKFQVAVAIRRSSNKPIRIRHTFRCKISFLQNDFSWFGFSSGLSQKAIIKYSPSDKSRAAGQGGKEMLSRLECQRENLGEVCGTDDKILALAFVLGLELVTMKSVERSS